MTKRRHVVAVLQTLPGYLFDLLSIRDEDDQDTSAATRDKQQ